MHSLAASLAKRRACAQDSLRFESDDVARNVFDLHQRHGQAIWEVLKRAVETHSAEFVQRSLPASSVLMMTVGAGERPALSAVEKMAALGEPLVKAHRDPSIIETGPSDVRQVGRSRPAQERALGAIRDLYPEGVPGQSEEPNTMLCRRVGERLKQASLLGVSDDTILRAAGRRK